MNKSTVIRQRLIAIFVIGCLLFNYPLLSLFSTETMLWGFPVLYVYVFVSWLLLIGLLIGIIESRH
ncbi:MAG TPA: hypothetical protein PKE64_23880 [Anaerolineae bacterium]|nr:hypothetical protein [Anaerolineae bacterium]HMR67062.1 hypothetical protein [Anaerolineae bacterium]